MRFASPLEVLVAAILSVSLVGQSAATLATPFQMSRYPNQNPIISSDTLAIAPTFFRSVAPDCFIHTFQRFRVLWILSWAPQETRRIAIVKFLKTYDETGYALKGDDENIVPWLDLLARHLRLYVLLLPFSPNFWGSVYFISTGAGMMWEWGHALESLSRVALWLTPIGPFSHVMTTLFSGWGRLRITPFARIGLALLSGPSEFAILAVALGLFRQEPRAATHLISAIAGYLSRHKVGLDADRHRERTTRRINQFVIRPEKVIPGVMAGLVLGFIVNLLFARWGWWLIAPSIGIYTIAAGIPATFINRFSRISVYPIRTMA